MKIFKYIKTYNMDEQEKITYVDGDIVVDPVLAKEAILKFLINEIGPFIEAGFKEERDKLDERLENEILKMKNHFNAKMDQITSDIMKEMKGESIKDSIIDKIVGKLKTEI